MRKLSYAAVLATLTFASACADSPTAVPFDGPLFSHDAQHNGPTYVLGGFDVTLSGVAIPAGQNQHPQGHGTCRNTAGQIGSTTSHSVWYNEQGRATSSKFCAGSAGTGSSTVACQITGIPATYAAAGNDPLSGGNENLNFYTEDEGDVLDQFVHFRRNAAETAGKGFINFGYSCSGGQSGQGTLALTQFGDGASDPAAPFAGNLFMAGPASGSRALNVAAVAPVTVVTGHGTGTVTSLHWNYRSRVGM